MLELLRAVSKSQYQQAIPHFVYGITHVLCASASSSQSSTPPSDSVGPPGVGGFSGVPSPKNGTVGPACPCGLGVACLFGGCSVPLEFEGPEMSAALRLLDARAARSRSSAPVSSGRVVSRASVGEGLWGSTVCRSAC